jgi:hypothetical protein
MPDDTRDPVIQVGSDDAAIVNLSTGDVLWIHEDDDVRYAHNFPLHLDDDAAISYAGLHGLRLHANRDR